MFEHTENIFFQQTRSAWKRPKSKGKKTCIRYSIHDITHDLLLHYWNKMSPLCMWNSMIPCIQQLINLLAISCCHDHNHLCDLCWKDSTVFFFSEILLIISVSIILPRRIKYYIKKMLSLLEFKNGKKNEKKKNHQILNLKNITLKDNFYKFSLSHFVNEICITYATSNCSV